MQNHNEEVTYQYAGFGKRAGAQIIDFIIYMIVSGIIGSVLGPVVDTLKGDPLGKEIIFNHTLLDIIDYVLVAAYFIVMTYFTGATVGKQVFKLKVISIKGDGKLKLFDVIYRETVGKYFSDVTFGLGYLTALFNDEKKAIHDMLCDTRVVEVKKTVPVRPVVKQAVPAPVAPAPAVAEPVAEEPLQYTIPQMIEEPASQGGSMPEADVQEQWKKILERDS